jgi:hypothetical protein
MGRWSRLKRERAATPDGVAAPTDPAPDKAQAAVAPETDAPAPKSDADVLAELGLPDPETLTAGDDFAAFMAKAVPEHLRRVALRRLWASKPIFGMNDGLTDYADDFTGGAVAAGKLATSYTVGRGFMTEDELARMRGPLLPHPDEGRPSQGEAPRPRESATDSGETAGVAGQPSSEPDAAAHDSSRDARAGVGLTWDAENAVKNSISQDRVTPGLNTAAARAPDFAAKRRMRFRVSDS